MHADDLVANLTKREVEILAMIAEGRSNAAIRRALVLSTKTVESHVRNVYAKLSVDDTDGCHRRVQAALIFLDARASRQDDRVPLAA